jgi:hypothetical protein
MFALLNPRLWIAAALVAILAFTHFSAFRAGRAHVRNEWQAATAAANIEARALEQQRQRRADEAQKLAAARTTRIAADAARARGESAGLRDDLSAVRLHAAQSLAAATATVAALSAVFEQCSSRYIELAQAADGHASDSLMFQESWPK